MAKFQCNVISYTLKRTVDITVVVPTPTIPESMGMGLAEGEKPTHQPKAKYPVLYLLHGVGNGHMQWTGYTKAELYAEEHQIILVCISGENKFYVDMKGDDFFTFVSEELPDFVTGLFPASTKPEDTYIAGLSMGGYGTFVHALNHPERYHACGGFSAAVDDFAGVTGETRTPRGVKYEPFLLVDKIRQEGGNFPKIYLACGKKDHWFPKDEKFRDALREAGADVTWDELDDYGHEWRFWDIEIEKFLKWLPRTDVYAGVTRKV